jgi:diguanylate cyclase (GGDEF)-like protein
MQKLFDAGNPRGLSAKGRRGVLRRTRPRDESTAAFALRLILSFTVTLLLVGVVGYLLMDRELRGSQVETQADVQRADVRTFELKGAEEPTIALAIREIDEVMDAIAERPGTLEALLVNERRVVVAAGDDSLVGEHETDPRIEAALVEGAEYAGRELDAGEEERAFEFVLPVELPDGRYAYEVAYASAAFDAELGDLRRLLLLAGIVTLVVGGAVFYLVGGRALLRSHGLALQRATRDGLTDLPNQRAFQTEFPQAIATASRHQESLALAVLDVDDFKFINDRYGHPQGDDLLKRVAGVLREGRAGDRIYRTGGDEFTALLPHADAVGAHVLARRLQRSLSEAGVQTSIGVSILRPGQPADSLQAEADAALYEAKRRGGNQVAHFDDIREHVVLTTLDKKAAVRALIDEGKLTTVFQPIWDFEQGVLLGVEALMRPDPCYGVSGPIESFDLADQVGRVHELDMLCVSSALANAPQLPPGALLFLNLCPQTLDLDADGNDWLRETVERAGLLRERVVVEVTERFGARTTSVIKCLERLREDGFKIALDDVGTGNSGLELLRRVNAEYVKLDRSVVMAAVAEPLARAVLMAMATFARQTGAYVIAEGIEDEDTLDFIRRIDDLDIRPDKVIQGGQGFSLGGPAPIMQVRPPQALHPVAPVS